MSEYTEKRWRCDSCGRDVRKGERTPPGWKEILLDFYGNKGHYCPDVFCVAAGKRFVEENYPSALEQFEAGD